MSFTFCIGDDVECSRCEEYFEVLEPCAEIYSNGCYIWLCEECLESILKEVKDRQGDHNI